MRKLMLVAVALAAAAGLNEAATAQNVNPQAAIQEKEMKVTGMVTEADEQTGKIMIGDKTFVMEPGGGATVFPDVGAQVTVFYEEQDGKNVVTRIGQAQQ